MSLEHHARVKKIYLDAADLHAEERAAFLDEACDDPGLRSAVDELLAFEQEEPRFLEETLDRGDVATSGVVLERLLNRIGRESRYQIQAEFARGGMGAILRVWDRDLRRTLAMKVVLGQGEAAKGDTPAVDEKTLGRFVEEAQVTGQLDHPGIVPVHELGLDAQGQVFFTMRLVKGDDLKKVFEDLRAGDGGWTQTRVLGVILKVCEAMAYAHSKRVIHRDLKPANIMVGRFGEAYVMDWGLARVEGQEDAKDIRVKAPEATSLSRVKTDRRDESDVDSPLMTMDGDVVGTPAFMSPEQARGDIAAMGPASDVYSLGAILYQLLAGHMPYIPADAKLNAYAVWALAQQGAPTPVAQLAKDAPEELVAICEKAMAREVAGRYRDMGALAHDLRAYLEGRVVRAHRTGAVVELRKWMRRNKGLATAIAAAVVLALAGLSTTAYVKSTANRELADKNSALRVSNERTDRALRSLRGYSDMGLVERYSVEATELQTTAPETVEPLERWLAKARELHGRLPDHEARLKEIRRGALERTPLEIEEDIRNQLLSPELEAQRGKLEYLDRALAYRENGIVPEPPQVDPSDIADTVIELNNVAYSLVEPNRTVFGREDEGLVLARAAVERASPMMQAMVHDTLAWALLANGRDHEAKEAHEAAIGFASEEDKEHAEYAKRILPALAAASSAGGMEESRREIAKLRVRIAELEREVDGGRLTYRFDDVETQWRHDDLAELVEQLRLFGDPDPGVGKIARIVQRTDFASRLRERSLESYAAEWARAVASIAKREECPMYDGLVFRPQLGLAPLGRDPSSGLWEFAHLQSGDVPERDDGELVITPVSGLVFVLVPGGVFRMGAVPPFGALCDSIGGELHVMEVGPGSDAERIGVRVGDVLTAIDGESLRTVAAFESWVDGLQEEASVTVTVSRDGDVVQLKGSLVQVLGAPNVDPHATPAASPVHEIRLDPYLISKYEMTQGQWLHCTSRNPSYYHPKSELGPKPHSLLHPVENVDWDECRVVLAGLGLVLPTEAQWEHVARAGTTSVWWTGSDEESLDGAANLADEFFRRFGNLGAIAMASEDWLDDGYAAHSPVGSYRANGFGLHDTVGNVWEWCRDRVGAYTNTVAPGDAERTGNRGEAGRMVRGGGYFFTAVDGRSALRYPTAPDYHNHNTGVRPARRIAE